MISYLRLYLQYMIIHNRENKFGKYIFFSLGLGFHNLKYRITKKCVLLKRRWKYEINVVRGFLNIFLIAQSKIIKTCLIGFMSDDQLGWFIRLPTKSDLTWSHSNVGEAMHKLKVICDHHERILDPFGISLLGTNWILDDQLDMSIISYFAGLTLLKCLCS